jgi:hypothetical protein
MEFRTLLRSAGCSSVSSAVGSFSKPHRLLLFMSMLFFFSCKDHEKILTDTTIISFTIKNTNVKKVAIDHTTGLIEINVPYGTLLSNKLPDIQISEGASIVPSLSLSQDFSKAVYYTVTGADGSKKVYKVLVTSEDQSTLFIQRISKDTIQAGDTLVVFGEHFGASISLLAVNLINIAGTETKISARLLDSTRLRLSIPPTLQPGDYHVSITRNNIKVLSNGMLNIRIPTPEVTDLKRYNLQQGDTLVLAGNFISDQFKYGISLLGETSNVLHPFRIETGKLSAVIDSKILPGSYEVQIHNLDEKTKSRPFTKKLTVYSNKLPFVTGILSPSAIYSAGESVVFKTSNFQSIPARFYSVQLTAPNRQFNQNGIFSSSDKTLSIVLPSDIPSSTYSIEIIFLDSSGNPIYELTLDNQLVVNP